MKFSRAKRSNTHLLIGIAGPTGCGKTVSALMIARGLMKGDDSKIFVIDTESGRALHYAPAEGESAGEFIFDFMHAELTGDFSPAKYAAAVNDAVKAGAGVIVIDSGSHEHEGPGGILDWHETELQRIAGNDFKKRDRCNLAAWIKPKRAHNLYVLGLLQLRAHIIVCFRAKDKIKPAEKKKNFWGRTVNKDEEEKGGMVNLGWTPICPTGLDYEMTDLLILPPGAKGIPDLDARSSKVLEHHTEIFRPGRQISEAVGRELLEWSLGGGGETPEIAGTATETTTTEAPVVTLDDILFEISSASSVEAMATVHKGIKDAIKAGGISDDDRLIAKDAYTKRMLELRQEEDGSTATTKG